MEENDRHIRPHVGYGPVLAIIMTVVFFYGAQILAGLLLSLTPLFTNMSTVQVEVWLQESVIAKSLALGLVALIELVLIRQFLRARRTVWGALGLVRPAGRDVAWAVGGYIVYLLVFLLMSQLLDQLIPGLNLEQQQEVAFSRSTTGLSLAWVFASVVLLPGITEEILFRGFLYTGLRTRLGVGITAAIVSLLFAIPHLQFETGNALLWIAALDTFILSAVLVGLRDRTNSLWPAILVHVFKNGVAFTFLFLIPGYFR